MTEAADEDQRLRAGLPMTGKAMIRAIIHHCGELWLEAIERRTQAEFAKKSIFGWKLLDTNVLFDIVPMPSPWVGEWGYRVKTVHIAADGEVTVCEYYLPGSQIAEAKSGKPQNVIIN